MIRPRGYEGDSTANLRKALKYKWSVTPRLKNLIWAELMFRKLTRRS